MASRYDCVWNVGGAAPVHMPVVAITPTVSSQPAAAGSLSSLSACACVDVWIGVRVSGGGVGAADSWGPRPRRRA